MRSWKMQTGRLDDEKSRVEGKKQTVEEKDSRVDNSAVTEGE